MWYHFFFLVFFFIHRKIHSCIIIKDKCGTFGRRWLIKSFKSCERRMATKPPPGNTILVYICKFMDVSHDVKRHQAVSLHTLKSVPSQLSKWKGWFVKLIFSCYFPTGCICLWSISEMIQVNMNMVFSPRAFFQLLFTKM